MNIDLSKACVWLNGSGKDSDVVLSTRLRLARNIQGFPFKGKITPEEEQQLESHLSKVILQARIAKKLHYIRLNELEETDRYLLLENHLISMEHCNAKGPRGVALNANGSISIMVNEEDHLRIQVLHSGLALSEGLEEVDRIESKLGEYVNWSFHDTYGYLTSCPTNVGTGLRVSVMVHLPALVLSKHLEKVFNAVTQMNLAVRGFFGEGSQAVGDLFQISNQITLGLSPADIVASLSQVLEKIIAYEREMRKFLMGDSKKVLEDKVWRALGTLRSARSISSEETMSYLSSLRLGITMKILDEIPFETVNQLFLDVQPGHLQKLEGQQLEPDARDVVRADLLRTRLKKNGQSG